MLGIRKGLIAGVLISVVLAGSLDAQVGAVASTTRPKAFGTQDYTVTTITGLSFMPADSSQSYHTSGSLSRYGDVNLEQHFYAALDIPAGVIIDFIGFNNLNDGEANVMAIHLLARYFNGNVNDLFDLDNTPHTDWQTDINATPVGIQWSGAGVAGIVLILDLEIAPNPNLQYFGSVEIWWKRTVSPAPATSDFGDVPTSSPQFQFIEALYYSGITAGCGGGNYCPNNPVTRGQMAVFLAKALGLHWPF
ncbi:MAG TPA: S-layer homology domain-containing protein [Thermoanaerobaculia bacterium]|nr:S-layer homology domain-containing protein [Thermoanaerobaculia bacterium]